MVEARVRCWRGISESCNATRDEGALCHSGILPRQHGPHLRLLLMCCASSSCCPSAPLLPTRSLPAQGACRAAGGPSSGAMRRRLSPAAGAVRLRLTLELQPATLPPKQPLLPPHHFAQPSPATRPPTRQVDEVQAAVGAGVGDLVGALNHHCQHLQAGRRDTGQAMDRACLFTSS